MSQYDSFADDFARTRSQPWSFLSEFIHAVFLERSNEAAEMCLDLGCGAGQYARVLESHAKAIVGADMSWNLLRAARSNLIHVVQCDALALPFRGDSFELCLCAAVLHHVLGRSSRDQAVHEMLRILTPRGKAVVTVWKRWQERFQAHFLYEGFHHSEVYFPAGDQDFGDIEIGWTDSQTHLRHPRSYHLFTEGELRYLLRVFEIITFQQIGIRNQRQNYATAVRKPLILTGMA